MLAKVFSAAIVGVQAPLLNVECDISQGDPSFDIIGLPEMAVREARVRVRSSIRHSGFPFPTNRVVVNLAPADQRKDGTSFDLPVALAILVAQSTIPQSALDGWLVVGELSLDGAVRPVTGVIVVAELAKQIGFKGIICTPARPGGPAAQCHARQ